MEVLFYVILAVALFLWIFIEGIVRSLEDMQSTSPPEILGWNDVRLACVYVLFLHLAIFGVEDLFNLSSVSFSAFYRLVIVFSDSFFVTRLLSMIKTSIPVLLVSIALIAMEQATKRRSFLILLLSGMLTDFINVLFFFMATSDGSWFNPSTGMYRHFIAHGLAMASMAFYIILRLVHDESIASVPSTFSMVENGRFIREKHHTHLEEFEF